MGEVAPLSEDRSNLPVTLFGEQETGVSTDGGQLPRVMVAPLHYVSRYEYPLLIWLHSQQETREREVLDVMPRLDLRHYVAVAPRGIPVNQGDGNDGPVDCGWPQTPEGIAESAQRVLAAISLAEKRFHIAEDRVFLAGFQAGGTMALRLAWLYPELFAGVISLCGPVPRHHRPLLRFTELRRVPVLLAVGGESSTFGPFQAAQDLKFLHASGVQVMLRQYPGDSVLSRYMLADVNRWIMDIAAPPTQLVR